MIGCDAGDRSKLVNSRPPSTRMHESWQPPPELAGSLPREFKWKRDGFVYIAMAVAIFVIGFGVLAATWQNADEDHRLKQDSQVTDSTVTRTWSESASRGYHYKVAYEFSASGKSYKGESELSQRNWKGLQVGSHTPVKYVSDWPEYNRLALAYQSLMSYWVPFGVFAFWIFMLALAVHPIRKERRLLRFGQAAPALVTSSPPSRRPKYGYITAYEFQLSDGTACKGSTQRDRFNQKGDWITVLYDPEHPRRSDIYPTRLANLSS
jgi:hypothetical protein